MIAARAVFQKLGRAKYISHLDLMRCLQRAFRRAEVPIWFTEGFHPHAYMTFALPLPLGVESVCECMDFRLLAERCGMDEAKERLNAVLPEGLRILRIAEPVYKHTEIAFADYEILFHASPDVSAERLEREWRDFTARGEVTVQKKTKRGIAAVNLKEHMEILANAASGEGFSVTMRLPAGTALNVSPVLPREAFSEALAEHGVGEVFSSARRVAILRADGSAFV